MLRTTGFGAHIAAIRPGHREFAADRRARFVNAAVHPRIVQRHAPAVGVARHHRHALFVALGHVRRNGVFLEQHNGQAAAEGIATVAMHPFFAGDRVQDETAMVPLAAKMNGRAEIVGMVAPGGRRPGGVRTQERERSEPDGYCGPWYCGPYWDSDATRECSVFCGHPTGCGQIPPGPGRPVQVRGRERGRIRLPVATRATGFDALAAVDFPGIPFSSRASISPRH